MLLSLTDNFLNFNENILIFDTSKIQMTIMSPIKKIKEYILYTFSLTSKGKKYISELIPIDAINNALAGVGNPLK